MGLFQGFCKRFVAPSVLLCVAVVAHTSAATSGGVSPPTPALSLQTGQMLTVIGVTQEESQLRGANRKSLENRRIGFGLTNLLVAALSDTGKFRLVEEKDVRKRELLENLVSTYWIEPGARFSEQMLQSVAMQLGVELLAYGSIAHSLSRQKVCIGPVCHDKQKLQTRVNVCLYAASTSPILCREGQGEAQQEGTGVIYEIRDDRLDFVNNAAGIASKQAVTLAVQALVTSVRFSP
jgi:hypothetical protein